MHALCGTKCHQQCDMRRIIPSSAEVVRDLALCKLLARVSTPLGSAFSRLVVGG